MFNKIEKSCRTSVGSNRSGDNEREEGEIVDDYEYIISSDEEFNMRQRIKELEATNEEIEQIAVISGGYGNGYNYSGKASLPPPRYVQAARGSYRAAQIPTDASSISSVEFPTSRKRKRRRSKDLKHRKHLHHRHQYYRSKGGRSRRHDVLPPSRYPYPCYYKSPEIVSLDSSYEVLSSGSDIQPNDNNDDALDYINRDKLRFAVARTRPNDDVGSGSLKERLLKTRAASPVAAFHKQSDLETAEIVCDSSDSLEEQELRLIALKSAVMRKHFARKKRDAEVAYSPTDFDDMLNAGLDSGEKIDIIDVDLEDSQGSMDISPVASPKLLLSPAREDEENGSMNCNDDYRAVDTKPVDMDIVNSSSEDEKIVAFEDSHNNWKPISLAPPPTASGEDCSLSFSYPSANYTTPLHYGIYIPELPLGQPPPPPPGGAGNLAVPPPPPRFVIEDSSDEMQEAFEKGRDDKERSANVQHNDKEENSDGEEEEALRALLLAKFQSTKNPKNTTNSQKNEENSGRKTSNAAGRSGSVRSENAGSSASKVQKTLPTASILKEAVRRLKSTSQIESPKADCESDNTTHSTNFSERHPIVAEERKADNEPNPLEGEELPENVCSVATQTRKADAKKTERSVEVSVLKESNATVNHKKPEVDTIDCKSAKEERSESPALIENAMKPTLEDTSFRPLATVPIIPKVVPKEALKKSPANGAAVLKAKPTVSYSVLRSTKIVKPNKVINKNTELMRKAAPNSTRTVKKVDSPVPSNASQTSRLITSVEQVKSAWKINQLIINVGASASETSEDELNDVNTSSPSQATDVANHDYYDNASPISLNMESPSGTPQRVASPLNAAVTKETGFEQKLDKFLKDVRSKVQERSSSTPSATVGGSTPLAVRHLPPAAQDEYRRLVYRMKMLETQRNTGRGGPANSTQKAEESVEDKALAGGDESAKDTEPKVKESSPTPPPDPPVVASANGMKPQPQAAMAATKKSKLPNAAHKTSKAMVLRSYENLFVKISAGIVSHLDKSLELVEEAKRAKIAKLRLERRLKELRAEMEQLQAKAKEEQLKISKICPGICSANGVITSLKQKRLQVLKAAINLGKTVKGEDYRLNNELKHNIMLKSRQLAAEIKLVNSIKLHNIDCFQGAGDGGNGGGGGAGAGDAGVQGKSLESGERVGCAEQRQDHNSHPPAEMASHDTANDKDQVSAATCDTSNEEVDVDMEEMEEECPLPGSACSDTRGPPDVASGNVNREFQEAEQQDANAEPSAASAQPSSDQSNKALTTYISPLLPLRNYDSDVDPNGIVCPYDLMGHCADTDCKYVHLVGRAST